MFSERSRYGALARRGVYQGRAAIENTVVAISRAYFTLVQQEQLLEVAREARDISAERLEKERVRHDVGGASSTDLLNAQVAFNTDQASLLQQELLVALARKDLNILLGRNPQDSLRVKREITVPEYGMTETEVLALARDNNSSYLAVQEDKLAADRQVRIARAAFFPRLSLTAGYGYSDNTVDRSDGSIVITESSETSIGLSVSMSIFNGRRDQIAVKNASLEAKNLALSLRDERNRLAGLVRDKHLTLQKWLQLVELEEQNALAARQNLELQQDRYRIGATSSLEFRDAQVNLIRSRTALIVARYEARIAHLEIQQLTGGLGID
jgi:outer membrane protein TolC